MVNGARKKENSNKYHQLLLVVFVWLLLIVAPILFRQDKSVEPQELLRISKTLAPLFIVFVINRFILVPRLLFRKKNAAYFSTLILLIISFTFILYLFDFKPIPQHRGGPGMEIVPEPAGKQMPPPSHQRLPQKPGERPMPPFINFLIFSTLLVGFDTGLMSAFRLEKAEKEKAKLEEENTKNQLAFLKNQVSPHFFMNTLNNIHALVEIDAKEAQNAIIRLSKMMSFMLYESNTARVALSREMELVKSYVALMKLRVAENVDIKLEIPGIIPEAKIPPLLTISFIENAFKYGISYEEPSFIHIRFAFDNNYFEFHIKNSIKHKGEDNKSHGIGIDNARKRLDLLFGKKYRLDIKRSDGIFEVNLKFPL